MENEIKQLKKEYDQTSPPPFLVENGINDLWHRVDNQTQNRYFNSRFFKYAMLGILVFFVPAVLVGALSTQAKADSALYPVKVFTQKAVTTFSEATFDKINKTQEELIENIQPTPTASPTPTVTPEVKKEDAEENKEKRETIQKEDESQKQNSENEEVKGASTSELNKNKEASDNSHGNNENAGENESKSKSNENNSQNQSKENGD